MKESLKWVWNHEAEWEADSAARRKDGVYLTYEIHMDEDGVFSIGGTMSKALNNELPTFKQLQLAKDWCQEKDGIIDECIAVWNRLATWEP